MGPCDTKMSQHHHPGQDGDAPSYSRASFHEPLAFTPNHGAWPLGPSLILGIPRVEVYLAVGECYKI